MTYAKKEQPIGTEQPNQLRDTTKIYKIGTAVGAVGWAAFAACMISHCGKGTTPVAPTPTATYAAALPTATYIPTPAYTPTVKAGKTVKTVKSGSKKTRSSLESKVKGIKTPIVQSPVEEEEDGLKKQREGEEP